MMDTFWAFAGIALLMFAMLAGIALVIWAGDRHD